MVRKISLISQQVHLKLNANVIQQYINNYIKQHEILYDPKKKENEQENKDEPKQDNNEPQNVNVEENEQDESKKKKKKPEGPRYVACSTSFITLTKLVEIIIDDIINNTLKKCKTIELGLYVISYEALNYNIVMNPNLFINYNRFIYNYDESLNYISMLAQYNYIKEYLDLSQPSKLIVDNKAINFLSFIVISVLNEILNALSYIIQYSHKSYFNSDMVATACGIIFKEPLKSILIKHLEETDKEYKQVRLEKALKAQEKKNSENNKNEEEKNEDNEKNNTEKKEQVKTKKEQIKPEKIINKTKIQNTNLATTTNRLVKQTNKK